VVHRRRTGDRPHSPSTWLVSDQCEDLKRPPMAPLLKRSLSRPDEAELRTRLDQLLHNMADIDDMMDELDDAAKKAGRDD
jgi:hypothetical protein